MVGLVSLGQLLPLLAGSLFGGPLVDAWDRRRVMMATQLLLAAGVTGLAVNSTLPHPLLWPLFACTAELAAFQGVDWAARRASLRSLVPPADLAAALSVQSAGFQLTLVVGPAAAGLLIANAGFSLVYWLNVVAFALSFLTVARLPSLRPAGGAARQRRLTDRRGPLTRGRARRSPGPSSSTWARWSSACPGRCSRHWRRPSTAGERPPWVT